MGAIDIIGSLEWSIEDTELYIRFSVVEAEYSTETQWRILMKEESSGSICGFAITPESSRSMTLPHISRAPPRLAILSLKTNTPLASLSLQRNLHKS